MIYVEIDELTRCLRDSQNNAIIPTNVKRIYEKSYLKHYNKKTGWYVNWMALLKEGYEIYALYVENDEEIQGLIALIDSPNMQAVFIDWMVAAPHNNKHYLNTKTPKYLGVGGHLFSIAIDKSFEFGRDGVVTGYAANQKLMEHYVTYLGALPICTYPYYQIMIDEKNASKIKEMYDYEWI